MPIDFKSLLHELANGNDAGVADSVLARRKNGPPSMQLTPAQSAVSDVVQGASDADNPNPEMGMKSGTQNQFPVVQGPAVGQAIQQQPAVAEQPTTQEAVNTGDTVQPSNIPDTPEYQQYVAAQQNGSGQQAAQDGTVRSSLFSTPVDQDVRIAQGAYVNAVNAPIVKQSLWKDIGARGLGALNAFVKGYRGQDNIEPAEGWGAIKHDNAVRGAAKTLGQLEQQQQYETVQGQARANIGKTLLEPQIQQQANMVRLASAQNLADYREKLLTQKNLTDSQRNDLLKEKNRLQAAGIKQNAQKIKQIDDKLNETVRHNKALEGQGMVNELGRITRSATEQAGIASRAKEKLDAMEPEQKQKAVDAALQKWMEQNPGYGPDDLANVLANFKKVYGIAPQQPQ